MTSAYPRRAPLPDIWWRQTLTTRRIIAAGIFVALIALIAGALMAIGGGERAPTVSEEFVADLPLSTVILWERLAECESGRQWDLATGNGFFGGLQFTETTWVGVGGSGLASDAPRDEQIMRASFLYDEQGWGAWPACTQQLGFTSPPVTSTGT